jgi:hypothetical protein
MNPEQILKLAGDLNNGADRHPLDEKKTEFLLEQRSLLYKAINVVNNDLIEIARVPSRFRGEDFFV